MFVTLHVAELLLLYSVSLDILTFTNTFSRRVLKHIYFQYPLSPVVSQHDPFQMYMQFKCAVSPHLYNQSLQLELHSKATIPCMKMTVFPFPSDQYTPSYDEIFPSNILNLIRCSIPISYLSKNCGKIV